MALAQAAGVRQGCPRCGGPMYPAYQDEYSCLRCGEYMFTEIPRKIPVRGSGKAALACLVEDWLGQATGDPG